MQYLCAYTGRHNIDVWLVQISLPRERSVVSGEYLFIARADMNLSRMLTSIYHLRPALRLSRRKKQIKISLINLKNELSAEF